MVAQPPTPPKKRSWEWLVVPVVLVLLIAYLYNLTGWRIFDDEGSYLYQVWRITQGEMPYRDFMTPQLPVYLYSGAAIMSLFGPSLLAMRLWSVALAFGSGLLLYLAGRKHHSVWMGLLALLLFLLHQDVFKELRIFRNEPLFIFFVTAGLVIATWSPSPRKTLLAIAGVAFGLGTMVKLFGLLPVGGVGLWLLWEGWREKRPFAQIIQHGLWLGVPLLLVVGLIAGGFLLIEPTFFDLTLGHHLAQGAEQESTEVVGRQLGLYADYFRFYPVLLSLVIGSAVSGVVRWDARQRWAWQLPMVLAFIVLTRQFGTRHFMLLLPAICLLAAWLLVELLNGRFAWWGRAFAGLSLLAILIPFLAQNIYRAQWDDTVTQPIVEIITEHTDPDEFILVDDVGLAFYAQRPTTYAGAALSHGAISSGQISTPLLIENIMEDNVRLVLIDTSLLTGNHIIFLHDYPAFRRFLARNFDYLGNYRRDFQEIDVWVRPADRLFDAQDVVEIPEQDGTQFGERMTLAGYALPEKTAVPGDWVNLTLFWTAEGAANNYWSVFVHLVDPSGEVVAQHDKVPYDGVYPPIRWYPNVIVDDAYAIQVPADAPPGTYRLAVGMYDWITGERLALFDPAGVPIPDNRTFLAAEVEVRP